MPAFTRTCAALADASRSLKIRAQVARELNLLSDRALADLGLFRSDIRRFARDAARLRDSESLLTALTGDVKAFIGLQGAPSVADRRI